MKKCEVVHTIYKLDLEGSVKSDSSKSLLNDSHIIPTGEK